MGRILPLQRTNGLELEKEDGEKSTAVEISNSRRLLNLGNGNALIL